MSALGQKQTFALQKGMSALPPIATLVAPQKVPSITRVAAGTFGFLIFNHVGQASSFQLGRARRLHLFVNTFVDDVDALVEIVADPGLFSSHPAFRGSARMCHRRLLNSRRGPACRYWAGAVGLASGKRERAGGE
jgi:hypothetical protein